MENAKKTLKEWADDIISAKMEKWLNENAASGDGYPGEQNKSAPKNEFRISDFKYDDGKREIEIGDADGSTVEIQAVKSLKMDVASSGSVNVEALFYAFKNGKKVKIEIVE